MASLSLPRVLQPRKTSLEIERENFEKSQNIALHKAINKEESPVKQKHVRSAIIGTFNQQGAQIFWSIAVRLPCMDDMIVAWKFCYVLHKILREGHPLCIDHSQRHRQYLEDIGKLWGHLVEGYGKLIKEYVQILIAKLDFHRRNPRFPGNLNVTTEDLMSICANNPDICFQLSVEMFDYLDTILELQRTIFLYNSSSMTTQGQCRLGPIIPCIQDASRIYDHNVKILFLLHSTVPYDVLSGHRDRFHKQFKLLKKFYQKTNTMHYFKNLISFAPLPDSPPNFQANFNTYVTQEVFVPQEEEEPTEPVNLIDTSESETVDGNHQQSFQPDNFDIIAERDNIIKNLQEDCERLRLEIHDMCTKGRMEKNNLEDQITNLETKLAIKESELIQEKQLNELNALSQAQDEEHKQREERFKASYLKLRDEHITLLREKAKIDKNLKSYEEKIPKLEKYNETLETKLQEIQQRQNETSKELQAAKLEKTDELSSVNKEMESLRKELECLRINSEESVKAKLESVEKLELATIEKQELNQKVQELLADISKHSIDLSKMKEENADTIKNLIFKSIEENEKLMRHAIEEIDNPALSALSCTPEYLKNLTALCQETLELTTSTTLDQPETYINVSNRISQKLANYIILGKVTSNSSPDIAFGEKMADECKALGESTVSLLKALKLQESPEEALKTTIQHLLNVSLLSDTISGSVNANVAENLDSMLENEISAMDKAIDEVAKKMQEMLSKSREADSGIKLQVNERILDSCTKLMQAIRVLVAKSKLLQEEIITQGKGTASAKEFYKRNHKWTDGFISAAKAIGVAASFLLNAADKVVSGQGKLEQLVVAAHEISASTAQLVVASRVKANRHSVNLKNLSDASKSVTNCTGAIVGTVKDCSEMIDEDTEVDTTNMTLHQAKRLEMEAQVRVLELEKELQQERFRLSALRRYHYQLAGEEEEA